MNNVTVVSISIYCIFRFFQLFRNLQGVNDEIKLEVLNEALENGIERGAKMAGDLKARHKLRDFFMHRAGVQSWSEVEEKYPESAIGVEKFVGEQKISSFKQISFSNFKHSWKHISLD